MSNFETVKEEFLTKEKFCSSLGGKKSSNKEYEHVLNVWKTFKIKTVKGYHNLKCF